MYPSFFRINSVVVSTYGISLMLALVVGYAITRKEARRCNTNPDQYTDLYFYVLVAAVIGSRFFYVLIDPDLLVYDRLAVFKFWQGGLVFYGGFGAALITAVLYLQNHSLPISKTLDIMVPGTIVGQIIGTVGCLLSGCMHGRPCDYPWAVSFQNAQTMAFWGVPLHPTQLYAVFFSLAIFGLIWWRRLGKRFDGELLWLYILLDAISRLVVDHYRGDFRGRLVGDLFSISQVISGLFICLAVVMLVKFKRA